MVENTVFKITTAEGYALPGVQALLELVKQLRQLVLDVFDIKIIRSRTQIPALIIVNKQDPLNNTAD